VIEFFVRGFVAGLAIAVPVGAIGVLLVDRALREGFGTAAVAGIGAATADFIYAVIAVTVGVAVADAIEPAITPLRVVAVVALFAIAIKNFRGALAKPADPTEAPPTGRRGRTYLTFLGLTILNPATMIYFASLIVGLDLTGSTWFTKSMFAVGAFVGSAGWQVFLAAIGSAAGARLGDRLRAVTSIIGAVVIAGLAIQMATTI
jgi:threonine/homoserine/homoserine lactone efflux protein